jgi:hypothetical protein
MTTCVPWTTDPGCEKAEWDQFPPEAQERGLSLAWAAMRHLSGGRVGNCPVMARPCRKGCAGASVSYDGTGTFINPSLVNGAWVNNACGCGTDGCSCVTVCEVSLPGQVARIDAVWLAGARLDPTAYRVDNGHLLVRQDGDCWPLCQDMTQPWDGLDAFTVVYTPGIVPDDAGLWAAGLLAYEFTKACTGGKCRLPSSVTSLARQGVSYEFTQGMFAGGVTGLREVDAYIQSINPHHLSQPSRVWSPDVRQPRYSALDLAACVCTALVERGAGEPCWCGIAPGSEASWVGCTDCGSGNCGSAWVRLDSAFPYTTFPDSEPGLTCTASLGYTIEVGVVRCMPLNDDGSALDTATSLDVALASAADMMALRHAVECCFGDTLHSLVGWSPLGPQGGCVGGFWTLQVGRD